MRYTYIYYEYTYVYTIFELIELCLFTEIRQGENNLLNCALIDVAKGSQVSLCSCSWEGKAAEEESGKQKREWGGQRHCVCVCVVNVALLIALTNVFLLAWSMGLGERLKWHLMWSCSSSYIDISSLVATTGKEKRERGVRWWPAGVRLWSSGLKRSKERRPAGVAGPIWWHQAEQAEQTGRLRKPTQRSLHKCSSGRVLSLSPCVCVHE